MTSAMMNALLGGAIAGLVGFLIAVPAILVEWREKKKHHDLPILLDVPPRFVKHLNHRELFFVAFGLHLVFSAVFGFVYPWLVEFNTLFITGMAYSLASLLVYAVFTWLVAGLIIFPLLGYGVFGKKEDGFVWLEILVTQLLLGFGMWVVIAWYQPYFF